MLLTVVTNNQMAKITVGEHEVPAGSPVRHHRCQLR